MHVNFITKGKHIKLPVYLVMGTQDLLTSPVIARQYVDSIRAPHKDFVLVKRAGHDPNQAALDAQRALLRDKVVPLIK